MCQGGKLTRGWRTCTTRAWGLPPQLQACRHRQTEEREAHGGVVQMPRRRTVYHICMHAPEPSSPIARAQWKNIRQRRDPCRRMLEPLQQPKRCEGSAPAPGHTASRARLHAGPRPALYSAPARGRTARERGHGQRRSQRRGGGGRAWV
eukprot:5202873-Prymnesium_polylepis.4